MVKNASAGPMLFEYFRNQLPEREDSTIHTYVFSGSVFKSDMEELVLREAKQNDIFYFCQQMKFLHSKRLSSRTGQYFR